MQYPHQVQSDPREFTYIFRTFFVPYLTSSRRSAKCISCVTNPSMILKEEGISAGEFSANAIFLPNLHRVHRDNVSYSHRSRAENVYSEYTPWFCVHLRLVSKWSRWTWSSPAEYRDDVPNAPRDEYRHLPTMDRSSVWHWWSISIVHWDWPWTRCLEMRASSHSFFDQVQRIGDSTWCDAIGVKMLWNGFFQCLTGFLCQCVELLHSISTGSEASWTLLIHFRSWCNTIDGHVEDLLRFDHPK